MVGCPENFGATGYTKAYYWDGSIWGERGFNVDGFEANDRYGEAVSISKDGERVAVGAPENDEIETSAGQVRVYQAPTCLYTYGNVSAEACDSYTWINGTTYIESTDTATHILTNANGCDSIITLDLTIYETNNIIQTIGSCEEYTWIDGNTYTESTDLPTVTLTNIHGCDSVITLNLTINTSTTGIDEVVACDEYTWIDGNTYTESTDSPTFTLTNVHDCDSVVTLNLTINTSTTGIDEITACDEYTWIDGNTYTESTDSPTFTLTNVHDCDSVVTLNLTIHESSTGIDAITACDEYTWIDGNSYTESTDSPTFTLTNIHDCDSVVTLNLTIHESNTGNR